MGTVAVGKNQAVIAAYLTMPVDFGSSALLPFSQPAWGARATTTKGLFGPYSLFFRRYQKAGSAGTVSCAGWDARLLCRASCRPGGTSCCAAHMCNVENLFFDIVNRYVQTYSLAKGARRRSLAAPPRCPLGNSTIAAVGALGRSRTALLPSPTTHRDGAVGHRLCRQHWGGCSTDGPC